MPKFDVCLVAYHEVTQYVTVEADDATDAMRVAVEKAYRQGLKEGDWELNLTGIFGEHFVKEIYALAPDDPDDDDDDDGHKPDCPNKSIKWEPITAGFDGFTKKGTCEGCGMVTLD